MVKWKFWKKEGEKSLTNLARLEKEGVLKTLTTDTLQIRIHELHDDLTEAFEEFRKGSLQAIIPDDLWDRMDPETKAKYIQKGVEGIQQKREALDKIVLALSDQAWPWNRAGDPLNRLMAFLVDEFLQDYEEFKEIPAFYDDLFTMALSIIQKSYKEKDVTKEVPIVIFMPQAGKGYDAGMMEKIKMEGEK